MMAEAGGIEINLTAVIMAVEGDRPVIFASSTDKDTPAEGCRRRGVQTARQPAAPCPR